MDSVEQSFSSAARPTAVRQCRVVVSSFTYHGRDVRMYHTLPSLSGIQDVVFDGHREIS